MYKYTNQDYSNNQFMYMYSEFKGNKFLDKFMQSRNFRSKKFNVRYKSKIIKNSKEVFSILLSFETKKKIYFKNKELSLNDYIELSYFSAIRIKKKIDLVYLNSLLKVNDYILFMLKKGHKNLNSKINKIFVLEKELITKVCKTMKINEKIKF